MKLSSKARITLSFLLLSSLFLQEKSAGGNFSFKYIGNLYIAAMYKFYIEGIRDLPPPGNRYKNPDKAFRFNDLPERIRKKIRTRGAKRTACWVWTGAIQPARARPRISRYTGRVYDKFETSSRLEIEPPVPQAWDGRTGAKVAAHRLVRSILTCEPISAVPRLGRCYDPRCVSPFHNVPISNPPPASQVPGRVEFAASTAAETDVVFNVLAVLKERGVSTSFSAPDSFPMIEVDCNIPAGLLSMSIWNEYVQWDMKENPDDY